MWNIPVPERVRRKEHSDADGDQKHLNEDDEEEELMERRLHTYESREKKKMKKCVPKMIILVHPR